MFDNQTFAVLRRKTTKSHTRESMTSIASKHVIPCTAINRKLLYCVYVDGVYVGKECITYFLTTTITRTMKTTSSNRTARTMRNIAHHCNADDSDDPPFTSDS